MASSRHAIVNHELHDHVIASLLRIGDVLGLLSTCITVSFQPLMELRAIGAVVSNYPPRPRVPDMIAASFRHLVTPSKRLNWPRFLEDLNSFLDCGRSLLRAFTDLGAGLPDRIAAKETQSFL